MRVFLPTLDYSVIARFSNCIEKDLSAVALAKY